MKSTPLLLGALGTALPLWVDAVLLVSAAYLVWTWGYAYAQRELDRLYAHAELAGYRRAATDVERILASLYGTPSQDLRADSEEIVYVRRELDRLCAYAREPAVNQEPAPAA